MPKEHQKFRRFQRKEENQVKSFKEMTVTEQIETSRSNDVKTEIGPLDLTDQ